MFRNKTGEALKNLIESHGAEGAQRIIAETLSQKKLRPEDFSIKELWEACQTAEGKSINVQEAVVSDSFPKITGELISSKIMSAYNAVVMIGDMLVTTIPSKQKIETFAGFTEVETPEEVPEGHEYNDSSLTEKFATTHNVKYGRMLSVTEEMIYFDQTGQIMVRANRIGQKAGQYREKIIVEGVQDVNSNVYRPSGTATAMYSTANRNTVAAAFGESGLEAAQLLMHNQKDDSLGITNDDFIYINDQDMIVLVPKQLHLEAWQLANSTLTPESAENAANYYKGQFNPLTSPYITAQSATTWFMGNFKEDFVWAEVWPLQTIAQRPGHEDEFKKDIKARVKVRMYGSVAALDFRHSYKMT